MITETGIYDIPDAEYLLDPVIEPSLNSTTAKAMIALSPAHAWAQHPRLGRPLDIEHDSTPAQDIGHVAHAMFLRGESSVAVLNVTDFRTNKAKDLRDEAIAAGRIPLKADRYADVMQVVNRLQRFRERTGAFTEGKPEQTLVWREEKQWSRCKVDWLPDDPEAAPWDLKTLSGRANTQTFSRSAFDFGYDMQNSFYTRGCECVRGEPPQPMKICVVETTAPYGIRVFEFSRIAIESADQIVSQAISMWSPVSRSRG